jgi:hypothetical protein
MEEGGAEVAGAFVPGRRRMAEGMKLDYLGRRRRFVCTCELGEREASSFSVARNVASTIPSDVEANPSTSAILVFCLAGLLLDIDLQYTTRISKPAKQPET